ncbi:hypothetical protein Zmor_023624 [Zophobas morio]|uniref:Uncharacterized protein n=1 Tax=Zophobas morio TaxID=2755281 RepID=A0AA38M849_9CUCU|nr:hypothetical protein Zmor_023624 [Zophobas morio]
MGYFCRPTNFQFTRNNLWRFGIARSQRYVPFTNERKCEMEIGDLKKFQSWGKQSNIVGFVSFRLKIARVNGRKVRAVLIEHLSRLWWSGYSLFSSKIDGTWG